MNCVTNIGQYVVNGELPEVESCAKLAVVVFRECV